MQKTILDANRLFYQKKYKQAKDMYITLRCLYPELKNFIDFNIGECEKKISSHNDCSDTIYNNEFKVVLINTNYQTKNLHITRAIYNALARHKKVKEIIFTNYASVIEDCCMYKPDILLAVDGQKIIPEILYKASRYVGKCMLWTFDDPYTTRDSMKYQNVFDIIFSNDLISATLYDVRSMHLPLASPLMSDFFIEDDNKILDPLYDVFFCGTAWPNRVEDLNKLIQSRPLLKYKFCLPYNKHVPKKKLYRLPVTSYVFPANFIDIIRMARRSKIVLGLHRNFGENQEMNSSNTPGPRVFEMAGMKAFQIVDGSCGAGEYYEDYKEIVLYNSFDNLIEKIDYYLNSDIARMEISKSGFNKTINNHTYVNRIDVILSTIDSF